MFEMRVQGLDTEGPRHKGWIDVEGPRARGRTANCEGVTVGEGATA